MTLLNNLIGFLIVITLVVTIHELGHFAVARAFGVRVLTFSLGMGRKLFSRYDRHGTEWCISAFPVGGYVKFLGDDNIASAPGEIDVTSSLKAEDRKYAFPLKPRWQKFLIVLAGPVANLLLTLVILSGLFFSQGRATILPVVSSVVAETPAAEAGLESGDKIIGVNGSEIESFQQLQLLLSLNRGEPIDIKIDRDSTELDITIVPRLVERQDFTGQVYHTYMIGIQGGVVSYKSLSFVDSILVSANEMVRLTKATFVSIWQMITGTRSVKELNSVIKIAQYSGESLNHGIIAVLSFVAIISLNLGIFNLLPIPMLDGGHLLFYSLEMISGRMLPVSVYNSAVRIGVMLLVTLMMVTIYNDLVSLL